MSWELIISRIVTLIFTLAGGSLTLAIVLKSITLQILKMRSLEMEQNKVERNRSAFSHSILQGLEVIHLINDLMDSVFQNTKVDRILILIASNDTPGFHVVSAIYERYRDQQFERLQSRYKRLKVDVQYAQLLDTLLIKNQLFIETDDLEDGFLKQIYLKEGVTAAILLNIGKTLVSNEHEHLVFSSFATYDEKKFTEADKTYISIVFRSVQDLLKFYLKTT